MLSMRTDHRTLIPVDPFMGPESATPSHPQTKALPAIGVPLEPRPLAASCFLSERHDRAPAIGCRPRAVWRHGIGRRGLPLIVAITTGNTAQVQRLVVEAERGGRQTYRGRPGDAQLASSTNPPTPLPRISHLDLIR